MHVAVVKGKAEDFIKEDMTNIGESLAKAIELIATQSKNTAFFPEARFNNFYRGMLSPYESPIAIYGGVNNFDKLPTETQNGATPLVIDNGYLPGDLPRSGITKREFAGTAVFNGDKMVGNLDSVETRYYLIVMGKYKRGVITINDKLKPRSAIAVDIRNGRTPQISSHFENGKPVIDVKLKIEGDIESIQSRINYEELSKLNDLNIQISEHLKNEIQKLIEKTQKELKADIFGFGHKVVNHFSTIQAWEKYNWLAHYPEAKVNVDVEVNIRRTGLMIHSAPITDPSSGTDGKESK
jgi:Ger(x)C family germination protein